MLFNMRDVLVLYQGMPREQRRMHYKKNRKELVQRGISWEAIVKLLKKE